MRVWGGVRKHLVAEMPISDSKPTLHDLRRTRRRYRFPLIADFAVVRENVCEHSACMAWRGVRRAALPAIAQGVGQNTCDVGREAACDLQP
jgi:hypothetical protein